MMDEKTKAIKDIGFYLQLGLITAQQAKTIRGQVLNGMITDAANSLARAVENTTYRKKCKEKTQ